MLAASAVLSACSSRYVTPGGPAPIGAMTAASVADRYRTAPESPMPATLAFTRLQAAGYRSFSAGGTDRNGVSMVGPKDLERDGDLEAVRAWPSVREVVRLTPIVVPVGADPAFPVRDGAAPPQRDPMLALREGAATLHADILLVYTIDTEFDVNQVDIGPLGVVTLGFVPNRSAVVRCTASAAFFDVRTGYCYGTAEASAKDDQAANHWTTDQAIDDCRRRVERKAFEELTAEAGEVWRRAARS
ncbi:MAG: hypothetical protein U0575_11235 [Phycisphaerales bacterium]